MAASAWLALILSASVAFAQDGGADSMRSGNAAFRNGQYAAAKDFYRSALDSGYDSALLQYNLGLAFYRLGEHAEAEIALRKAATDPALAPLATYNLGLTSLAAGWLDAAESYFERAMTLSADASLTALAGRALDRARVRRSAAAVAAAAVPADSRRFPYREPEPPVGDLYFVIAARYGADDNVYRTPSASYVDIAQSGQPTISPTVQSATFTPVDVLARYAIVADDQDTQFEFVYRLNGDFYSSEFSNADVLTQRIEVGGDLSLEGKHERLLETAFFGVSHDETNFDPDTGVDREIGGQDISDRFSYRGAGIDTSYLQGLSRWAFGFDTRIERRSYEDTPAVSPIVERYDHEFYHVNLWTERQVSESLDLRFALHSYRREYDARRARDAAGVLATSNPTLEYAYSAVDIGAVRRFGSGLSLSMTYRRVDRTDNFDGYADLSENAVRLGLEYRPNRRTRLELSARARAIDYPNAFAFNDPAGGALDIDSTDAVIDFEYGFRSNLSLWTELVLRDVSSTDPRIGYARNLAILGIKWRH